VHAGLFGSGPLFHVPAHDFAGLPALPVFVLVGLAAGALAIVITQGLFWIEHLYRRLPVSEAWHPIIGAAAFGSLGLLVPRALGVGYDVIDDALAGRLALATLAALAIGKLVIWWVALASGTSGGTLAPILLISASSGAILGRGIAAVIPGDHLTGSTVALVAMAATFGAATRAPFTAIVFLFELTGDYGSVLPLMLATVVADLIARAVMRDSLMTEKLTRRGVRVPSAYYFDALRTTLVADVMTAQVETLPASMTVAAATERFSSGGHGAYPIVDDAGALVGIIARGDLLVGDLGEADTLGEVAERDIVSVRSDDTVWVALQQILEEGVDHLPVIDDGALVGMCTRTDVLGARRRQLELERTQPGWLAKWPWGAAADGREGDATVG